jgi:hypothetical protein
MALRTDWARGTAADDPVTRAIAVALLAGETAKLGDLGDSDQFCGILDIAVTGARDARVRTALAEIRDGLASWSEYQDLPNEGSPLLISVSVDVVGSTEAKRRLRDVTDDEAWRLKLYRNFYTEFLFAEDRFYSALFEPRDWGTGPPLDWRRLFVVKGIGDEIWLTYEVVPPNDASADAALRKVAVRMISAALELAKRSLHCGGTSEDEGPHFEPHAKPGRVELMDLPFKISMDLVEDAVEISKQRLEALVRRVGAYLAPPQTAQEVSTSTPLGASHVEALRRLNAGHFELVGGHRLRQAFRTDFIGPDVDRFFRLTKFALPGLVMVGDNLMRRLSFETETEISADIDRIRFSFARDLHYPQNIVGSSFSVFRTRRPVGREEMKGVDAAYAVYHLIEEAALRGILHQAERNEFLKPTTKELPIDLRRFVAANVGDPPTGANGTRHDRVERLAYELWQRDGGTFGNDTHYWLAAEDELIHHDL